LVEGLRLAVDQTGKRTYDQNINRLTVIANEAYDDFAKALQKEIEEDCGVTFTGRIKNKKQEQLSSTAKVLKPTRNSWRFGKNEKENHLQSRLQNRRVNYFGCKSHKRFA
jgi:restriction endonuclease